jgi:hypothetical protein
MLKIENQIPCVDCGVNQHQIHLDFCTKAWCPVHYETSHHGNTYFRQVLDCHLEGKYCESIYRGGIHNFWVMSFNSDSQISDLKKEGKDIPINWVNRSLMHNQSN